MGVGLDEEQSSVKTAPRRHCCSPRGASDPVLDFEEPLDALSTSLGRRSPSPFGRDRGGSTFVQMMETVGIEPTSAIA